MEVALSVGTLAGRPASDKIERKGASDDGQIVIRGDIVGRNRTKQLHDHYTSRSFAYLSEVADLKTRPKQRGPTNFSQNYATPETVPAKGEAGQTNLALVSLCSPWLVASQVSAVYPP